MHGRLPAMNFTDHPIVSREYLAQVQVLILIGSNL